MGALENGGVLLVVAAALSDAEGRVLVQRRPAGKAHAGLWEFPGGKVEPGEAPQAALARELEEELGIAAAPGDFTPFAFGSAPVGSRTLILLLYTCARWSGILRAIEAEVLAWHHPADLQSLPMPPADLPLVAALQARERHVDR